MSLNTAEQYNMRSPAVKRILREAAEMRESTYEYYAQPLEDNIFEWHFTVRGAEETDFTEGLYHGRIVLPNDYPMKPPSIILLTPNGRFEVNKKICLSISGYHPETWQPCWSIRTVLLAIIAFMPTKSDGAIGSLDYSSVERKQLARRSHRWQCGTCGPIQGLLKEAKALTGEKKLLTAADGKQSQEDAVLADFMAKVSFQSEKTSSSTSSSADEAKECPEASSSNRSASTSSEASECSSAAPTQAIFPAATDLTPPPLDGPLTTITTSNNSSAESSELPPAIEAVQQHQPPTPPVRTTSLATSSTGPKSFLHGPITNGFLTAIILLIVAILLRRVLMVANLI